MSQPLDLLDIFKGNDWKQRLQVYDNDQTVVNVSGYGIVFSVNDEYNENPLTAVIQKANVVGGGTGTEINMGSATNGIYQVIIDAADTSGINAGDYFYDIKFVISSKEYTQKVGIFRIKKVVNI